MSQTNSGPGLFVSGFSAPSSVVSPATNITVVWDGSVKGWVYWNGTLWFNASGFYKHKPIDQTTASGGTTDADLVFPVLANTVWRATYSLEILSASGLVVTPSPPAGSTFTIGSDALGLASPTNLTLTSSIFYNLVVTVAVGSTAGNVNIGYSAVTGATVKALSSMVAQQLN